MTSCGVVVEEDYQHKSYAVREAKVEEFDAFCNRMRVGDRVLTTSQGKTCVGRIGAGRSTRDGLVPVIAHVLWR